MKDGTLECAYHGLRYDMTGKCVMIPSHPTGPISPQAVVRPFPIVEQDGLVWFWPGDAEVSKTRKPPSLPEVGSSGWKTEIVGPMEIPANYLLLIENLLDITHFYPLHDGNIGDMENSRIPVDLEEGEEGGNRYAMTVRKVTNYRAARRRRFDFRNMRRKRTGFRSGLGEYPPLKIGKRIGNDGRKI